MTLRRSSSGPGRPPSRARARSPSPRGWQVAGVAFPARPGPREPRAPRVAVAEGFAVRGDEARRVADIGQVVPVTGPPGRASGAAVPPPWRHRRGAARPGWARPSRLRPRRSSPRCSSHPVAGRGLPHHRPPRPRSGRSGHSAPHRGRHALGARPWRGPPRGGRPLRASAARAGRRQRARPQPAQCRPAPRATSPSSSHSIGSPDSMDAARKDGMGAGRAQLHKHGAVEVLELLGRDDRVRVVEPV